MHSVGLLEKVALIPKILALPIVLFYTALISRFSTALRKKRFNRLLFEASIRYLVGTTTPGQIQWAVGPTVDVYKKWARKRRLEPVLEDVPDSGRKLMWIGSKEAEKVVFYVHGGGFIIPVSDFMFTFWRYVQREYVKQTGKDDFAIVCMEYSLHPHPFPTQLREMIHALSHVLSTSRASPSTIHLAGDSAGANLVLQFISHALHPLPSTDAPPSPLIVLNQRVRGTLLISPWLSLDDTTPTHTQNDVGDCLSAHTMTRGGVFYLDGLDSSRIPYVKVLSKVAGERWFEGVEKVTERVFVTVGGAECLLGDGVQVYERIKEATKGKEGVFEVKVDVEEDAVHEDMMVEFGAGGKKLTTAGHKIVEWLIEGYKTGSSS
ncbi:hypothetical protein V5O48_018903 [Marasmius crinis-equi]|uniref:Alpha/beta hydrolase fold-3 domain-containing protein n=1 Tax=Marasmius crinis-equi TaxID=585013 RepID=A0ABR3EJU9_9AGAR